VTEASSVPAAGSRGCTAGSSHAASPQHGLVWRPSCLSLGQTSRVIFEAWLVGRVQKPRWQGGCRGPWSTARLSGESRPLEQYEYLCQSRACRHSFIDAMTLFPPARRRTRKASVAGGPNVRLPRIERGLEVPCCSISRCLLVVWLMMEFQ